MGFSWKQVLGLIVFLSAFLFLVATPPSSSEQNILSQAFSKTSDIPDLYLERATFHALGFGHLIELTEYFQQQLDLSNYFSNIPSNATIKVGVVEQYSPTNPSAVAYTLQMCTTSDRCGSGFTGNHFNGANKDFPNHYFGGTLPTGTTTFWVQKHGSGTRSWHDRTVKVEITTSGTNPTTLSDEFRVTHQEVGFTAEHPLSFEPRKGKLDQILLRWPNLTRYQPGSHALITTTAGNRNPSDLTTSYSVHIDDERYFDNSEVPTFNNEQTPLVVPDHYVTTDSDGYVAYTTHTIEPDLERFARISYVETRHGINYHITSEPVAFFTPNALTAQKQPNNDFIQISWTDTYTDTTDQTPNIDQWQYRIGHTPGTDTPEQTGFTLQPTWTTTQWTTICTTDLTTETNNNNQNTHTHLIKGPGTHPTNNCGPDTTTGLPQGHQYIIQLKGNDQNRNPTPQVRNLITTQPINIPAPTPTTQPTTPSTPSTAAPTTQPTTPNTSSPTTQPTSTNPTNPGNTTPTTPTPSTQPPSPPTGGIPPVVPSGNNPPEPTHTEQPTTRFTDTIGHTHEQNIGQLADMGVTRGCNPPTNTKFCPDRAVTRAEMATFLTRAFNLNPTDQDPFTDTSGNVHRPNINRMAAAGISRGCNPPTNTRFCPNRAVTRAEMATFMTRVLELEEEGTGFDDTQGNVHANNIGRFAEAGITRGCNPPENNRYCPDRAVTRAEMATFLVRSTSLNNS